MHWSEFSVNLSSALLVLKCMGLDVMRMMNRAIKMMFRREKCIIYHFCLIAALNIQTISIPVYQVNQPLIQNVICGYFLQPSLVTASPDLNRPGSVGVKNQLGSDMRRPLPWYTDTDTIFRSWPGPGYVSGDRRVSGTFCQPRRHATRSQLHLKWTRTIYQCLMDRVLKIWMNTRDHVTCQNWQLGRSYPAPKLVR